MVLRLLALVLAALFLTACSDTPDDSPLPTPTALSPTATTFATMVHESAVIPTAEATPASSPTPVPTIAIATVTPTREPEPVGTPEGSTGLEGGALDPNYDEACFSGGGDDGPLPPAGRLDPPPYGAVGGFPGPYTPIPFAPEATLQSLLDAALGASGDSYAYYVKDLATGRGAMHNTGAVFNAASLFKLFVMYEVFHQESLGLVSWSDELVVTPYYDAHALSPRVTELCQVITVGEAMDAMLSISDNAAAVLLQDLAGSNNINAAIAALGLTQSGLFEDGLPVTAEDLALLMEAIATGNAVSPEASADMLRLLDHDVFENGLLTPLPPGTMVARKTGNWSDATNVAGVVYAPSGPYVFIALTSNGYETHIIEALSRASYEYFTEMAASAQTAP